MRDTKAFIETLRFLADAFERNPTLPVPFFGSAVVRVENAEEIRKYIQAIGGNWIKKADNDTYDIVREFPGSDIGLLLYASHEAICKRIVKGTVRVPEQVIEATEARVIPAHDEELVEWVCPDSILQETT